MLTDPQIVDCFAEENSPLVLAEVELEKENELITKPSWCGKEITGEYQWSNASLAQMPISQWTTEKKKVFKIIP